MTKGYEPKLGLDMPFGEALERFVGVKPAETEANVAKAKKKRPPGGRKRKPTEGQVQAENVRLTLCADETAQRSLRCDGAATA